MNHMETPIFQRKIPYSPTSAADLSAQLNRPREIFSCELLVTWKSSQMGDDKPQYVNVKPGFANHSENSPGGYPQIVIIYDNMSLKWYPPN